MSSCPSESFPSKSVVVGLTIAGTIVVEALIAVVAWFVVSNRRWSAERKARFARETSGQPLEEGETTAYTHRSSFLEKWLGREAVTTYTPVEIEEAQEKTHYASYVAQPFHANIQTSRPPLSLQNLALPSFRPPQTSQDGHDVSFYSTAVAANLAVPSSLPIPYDPPPPVPAPLPRQRPELPKLDIPKPLATLPRENHEPSVTSQISYLRRLSRSLLATFSNPPCRPPPDLPLKPQPPTPPPCLRKDLRDQAVPTSIRPIDTGKVLAGSQGITSQREHVRPLPMPNARP